MITTKDRKKMDFACYSYQCNKQNPYSELEHLIDVCQIINRKMYKNFKNTNTACPNKHCAWRNS